MHPVTFSDLPYEVQEHIALYLKQSNLVVCVSVCKAWKARFIPLLWTHPSITWNHRSKRSTLPETLNAYGHHIRSLNLVCPNEPLSDFLKACPSSLPLLNSMEVDGLADPCWVHPPLNSTIFPAGWKRVVYRLRSYGASHYVFGTKFFEGMAKHAATLEVLRLESRSFSLGTGIHHLMCLAVNLKELIISSDRLNLAPGYLDARAIVDTDWACDNLEVFVCPIRRVPRPDITRRIKGDLPSAQKHRSGTLEESINIHHRVYTKLSRFTKLRELKLGFPSDDNAYYSSRNPQICRESYRQYDCLAMTLDSGLDLLKGLKKLRKVGLEDMEVYIHGVKEQMWFAEHWPHAVIKYEGYWQG